MMPRPVLIRRSDPAAAVNESCRGEVRAGHLRHQFIQSRLRIVDQEDRRVDDLRKVVGWNVRRHADGDPGGSVDEQIGESGRQDQRLGQRPVVVGPEIDGFLVDVGKQLIRDARHADLGVTHGRGIVAVDRAEVALAVDQRVADRKILHQTHDRVVDRGVAVRMVFADDVADDARRLLVGLVVGVAEVVHRVQHAAMHRLEPVARIGQGPADDDAHRIVQVGLAHLVDQIYRYLLQRWIHSRAQMSRLRTLRAFSSMNRRLGSTASPIRIVKMASVCTASSIETFIRVRDLRIHGGAPELLRVHFAQPLVTLDGEILFPESEDVFEQCFPGPDGALAAVLLDGKRRFFQRRHFRIEMEQALPFNR